MGVVGVILGWVKVDDARQRFHVDSSSSNISGHKGASLSRFKGAQRALALCLGAIAMDRYRGHAGIDQLLGQTISTMTGATENDCSAQLIDGLGAGGNTVVTRDVPEHVCDIARGFVIARNVVASRVFLEFCDDLLDLLAEGGREEEQLAIGLGETKKSAHRGEEPHVGHTVGFIDHHHFDIREIHDALFNEVLKATGACHEHIDTLRKSGVGGSVTGTAIDSQHPTLTSGHQHLEFVSDLSGKLAGGLKDQATRATRSGTRTMGGDGNTKGDGLSRACWGLGKDISASKSVGKRRFLNGEGLSNSLFSKGGREGRVDPEIGKGGWHLTPDE